MYNCTHSNYTSEYCVHVYIHIYKYSSEYCIHVHTVTTLGSIVFMYIYIIYKYSSEYCIHVHTVTTLGSIVFMYIYIYINTVVSIALHTCTYSNYTSDYCIHVHVHVYKHSSSRGFGCMVLQDPLILFLVTSVSPEDL